MKKITLLLILLLTSQFNFSQITIPDANFKAALIAEGVDTSGNGEIEESEALAVTQLDLSNKNISDLEGIEFFTNLLDLNCETNQITNIDLSETLDLKFLDLSSNPITNLNLDFFGFTDSSKLEILNLVNCLDLTNLDLPIISNLKDVNLLNSSSLQELFIQSNELNSVNVTNMSGLEVLYIGGIGNNATISSLDLSNLISLKNLEIGSCYSLTTLNLSGNQNLERIDFVFDLNQHSLTNVDFSNLSKLKTFNCVTGGNISSINLEGTNNLEEFWIIDNQLTSIDFSGLTNLKSIDLSGNQLMTLDVSDLTN